MRRSSVRRPTSVGLTSPANPSVVGQAATFTAIVTATGDGSDVPTGTVQFRVDDSDFGSPVALVNGKASTLVTPGAVGQLTLSATYSGSASYLASSGAAQTLSVVAPFTLTAPADATLPAQVAVTLAPQAGFSGTVDLSFDALLRFLQRAG